MIVNRLNQLYKPKRTLYYIDASKEDILSFYKGVVPSSLVIYADAFGSYDYPGVFYVRQLQKEVIGIEFRNGDPRVEYPTEMESLELDAAFFYSIEIDDDAEPDPPFVRKLFEEIAGDDFGFVAEIGLKENLSPTRANGLVSMIDTIKRLAENGK